MTHEPTEIELRVAYGIYCRGMALIHAEPTPQDKLPESSLLYYLDLARTAIRAMSEPTGEMLAAAAHYHIGTVVADNRNTACCWPDMIDAASPPE